MLKVRVIYCGQPEGAEIDCPYCGETAIVTDDGIYCPNCGCRG